VLISDCPSVYKPRFWHRAATGDQARCPAVKGKELRMASFEEVRTITADGRLVVPWVIQRALGLEHGGPVRFQVENGVVTLIAVDARRSDAGHAVQPRRDDVRAKLAEELRTLLSASERDRANEPVNQ
jgi:bifunctional DNA-binding transcriptional regulator/antitoxin component of YhaV-PrlF toxin-antitoxin module